MSIPGKFNRKPRNPEVADYDPSALETEEFNESVPDARERGRKWGKTGLEHAKKGEKAPAKSPEKHETAHEIGIFRKIEFKRRDGESDADFLTRSRERRERKFWAAMMYGPEALKAQDVELRDRGKGTDALLEAADELAKLDTEEFEERAKGVISNIETPFDREGAKGMYEKIRGDRAMMEIVFLATREAWKDDPDAKNIDADEAAQERMTVKAIESFMKKYPTAADVRGLERELIKSDRFEGVVMDDESIDKKYRGKKKTEVFETAVDGLTEMFYGMQEEYMRTAEDIYDDLLDEDAEVAKKTETTEPKPKPKSRETEIHEKEEKGDIYAEDDAVKEDIAQKIRKKKLGETKPPVKPNTPEPVKRPEVIQNNSKASTYGGAKAERRGSVYMNYGYDGARKFVGTSFYQPHTPKFGSVEAGAKSGKAAVGESADEKIAREKEEAERKENAEKKQSLKVELMRVSVAELEKFKKVFMKLKKIGESWHSQKDGKNYTPVPETYLNTGLEPKVWAGDTDYMLSDPFMVGERKAVIVYHTEKDKNGEEVARAFTAIQDREGDFGRMAKYYRRIAEIGREQKAVVMGIDWEKTDAEQVAIENETLKKAIEKVAKETEPVALPGDAEYFAAATAEKVVKIDS